MKEKIKGAIRSVVRMTREKEILAVPEVVNAAELLSGKVALITGGSGGIGMAIAQDLLRSGCKVILAGTSEEKLQNCLTKWGGKLGSLATIVIDVTQVQSLPEKVRLAAELFPEKRIDILVNSAGMISHTEFLDMPEEEYDRIMDVNAKGTFFMSQAVAKHMIENHVKGHILNVSSSSALRPAWCAYRMSKWAVRGLTLGMADKLLPYGIVVNAIAPGPTATSMLGKSEGDSIYHHSCPAGRYVLPEEIARLATFMVSGMGDMIVGDTFYMTGGSGTITLHG